MPPLFAFTSQVVGNQQMATFAAFGSFATLLFASFGGSRRDKLLAHTLLAVAGSVLIIIGTAISFNTAVAAVVTVPVAFCVLFSGIVGPMRPPEPWPHWWHTCCRPRRERPSASSPTVWRGGGWPRCSARWPCSCCLPARQETVCEPPPPDQPPPCPTSSTTRSERPCLGQDSEATMAAKRALMNAFDSSPYRPTGLAVPDQALANLVESLEWCTTLVSEALREGTDLKKVAASDRRLFAEAATVLR